MTDYLSRRMERDRQLVRRAIRTRKWRLVALPVWAFFAGGWAQIAYGSLVRDEPLHALLAALISALGLLVALHFWRRLR